MYLIGHKGVMAAVNRETVLEKIQSQLAELDDRQLQMAADYIHGLIAADKIC